MTLLWGRTTMEGAGRILNAASWMVAAGAALSGPVAMGVVLWAAPQPAWSGVVPFVEHYHPIQGLPYLLGFLLLGGFILFVSACHAGAAERHRARTTAALLFTSTYAALVFLNYALQVGLVPRLVPAAPEVLGLLTMANPDSLAWFLEMFGYAALGIGLWLLAPLFPDTGRGRAIRWLLRLNALGSVAGAVAMAAVEGWVFSTSGLAAFVAWNVLVIACFVLIATAPGGSTPVGAAARD